MVSRTPSIIAEDSDLDENEFFDAVETAGDSLARGAGVCAPPPLPIFRLLSTLSQMPCILSAFSQWKQQHLGHADCVSDAFDNSTMAGCVFEEMVITLQQRDMFDEDISKNIDNLLGMPQEPSKGGWEVCAYPPQPQSVWLKNAIAFWKRCLFICA